MTKGEIMGVKAGELKSEVMKVRLTLTVREDCAKARAAGPWAGRTESDFLGYLIELGLTRYRNSILPIERGEDLAAVVGQEQTVSRVG